MQITAQHTETVGESSAEGVEEWFLFDGIALHPADVPPGHLEHSALVESHLANTGLSVGNGAAVSAREAAHTVAVKLLAQLRRSFPDFLLQDFLEVSHTIRPLGFR